MDVGVDEARTDIATGQIEYHLGPVALTETDDVPVGDRDIRRINLAGEDIHQPSVPQHQVGRLIATGQSDQAA